MSYGIVNPHILSSSSPQFATAVIVALPILACISLGCDKTLPGPSEVFTVTSVFPNSGPAVSGTEVSIRGSAFDPGASVMIGGAATSIRVISTTLIVATTPISSAGTVDVVVTNPGGLSVRLAGAFTYLGLVLTDVSPTRGLPGDLLTVLGVGFTAGAALTVDGVASAVLQRTSTSLTTFAPSLPPGSADITVVNPNGERQTLPQAFTFDTVSISASPSAVTAGGPLSVTFLAPNGRTASDWVGLFRFGDANDDYIWFEYTGGSTQGTITIPAPNQPGDYQFRYLANDGYIDAARSGVVNVTAAGN